MDWTRRLRLRHLQWLVGLAESGSLSDTARAFHTTQPGLSKWLKELEDDAGAMLFQRHARGLTPTAQGEVLVRHAQRILSEMARAQSNLEALSEGDLPTLAIGTSAVAAATLVPDAVARFLQRHSRARISIVEGTLDGLLERLQQGSLDIVVGRTDNYQPREGLVSELLFHEPITIVARPEHPLLSRPTVAWRDLYDYDWLLWPAGTPIRRCLDAALTHGGHKPLPCRVESTSLMANLWLMQSTDLLSIASGHIAAHFTRRGLLRALPFALDGHGAVGMFQRDDGQASSALAALCDTFRAVAGAQAQVS
ncbi:LysR substrate-binding domain-containing protein [Pseudomonas wadenswilerensis]